MGAAEVPPLLDAEGFLEELERFEYLQKRPSRAPLKVAVPAEDVTHRQQDHAAFGFDEAERQRAHTALERALEPEYHRQQVRPPEFIAPSRAGIPPRLVALVLLLGLAAGAGVAGMMFYERVAVVVQRIHK